MASRYDCCLAKKEMVDHLFVRGAVAREVWIYFECLFGINSISCEGLAKTFISWYLSREPRSVNHIKCFIPLVICWFCGKEGTNLGFRV